MFILLHDCRLDEDVVINSDHIVAVTNDKDSIVIEMITGGKFYFPCDRKNLLFARIKAVDVKGAKVFIG